MLAIEEEQGHYNAATMAARFWARRFSTSSYITRSKSAISEQESSWALLSAFDAAKGSLGYFSFSSSTTMTSMGSIAGVYASVLGARRICRRGRIVAPGFHHSAGSLTPTHGAQYSASGFARSLTVQDAVHRKSLGVK